VVIPTLRAEMAVRSEKRIPPLRCGMTTQKGKSERVRAHKKKSPGELSEAS